VLIGAGLDARLQLPFHELREAAVEAERLGFESVWTPAGGVPDAFHICRSWLDDTGLRAGTAVVPALRMWTPEALAAQAATLAQLSGGRFVLGLGTGGYGPAFFASKGLPNRPISVMRDFAIIVKGLLAGETVSHHGRGISTGPTSLGLVDVPNAPVYLAALGPQMLALAGEVADGALLNWATPERIILSREIIAEAAIASGRQPDDVTVSMYVRVCVDDDVNAARRALGAQVLGYALARPGITSNAGYRGLFGQMGFDEVLLELEGRRDHGESMDALVDATPDDMINAVGYYGPATGAPQAFARLSAGLDETVVRIVTARPGIEPVVAAMNALTPNLIRAAQ
jgi:alkanesulfonate monooxygenase SsuD/methylene tetrahydromethanopterin reductase-like flavin-dependent oxidoreductase (luciferase family)